MTNLKCIRIIIVIKQALTYAEKYIANNDLPAHTQLEVMTQFGETAMFKQFFSDWRDLDETDGMGDENVFGSGVAKVEHEDFDANSMHDSPDKAAEFGMPDDGSGEKKIYRIVDSEREELDEDKWGIFYSSECYLISYTYDTPKDSVQTHYLLSFTCADYFIVTTVRNGTINFFVPVPSCPALFLTLVDVG